MVTSFTVALASFPSSFSMMSHWDSWVTFTALWWSWSAANVTATPTPTPAASVNKIRIMVISYSRFSLPGGDLHRPAHSSDDAAATTLTPAGAHLSRSSG